MSTGSGVVVAVVDTGIRPGTDLANTAFTAGWDFINNDDDPPDDNGHGTHIAGTIAQSTNNGVGVAGVAYRCTLMPVKVLDAGGVGTDVTAADGIRWAADHGAQVINLSLGADAPSTPLEEAVTYASGKGVILVCASGNSMGTVGYPAAYPSCIAVGATTYDEAVAYYSNGGSALDLTAPGGNDWADLNSDGYIDGVLQQTFDKNTGAWAYYFYVGTSMAAPHVSGVAALLIAQGIYTTPAEVKSRLESTAEDKGTAGWDTRYGWGIVNAYAALAGGTEPPPTLSSIAVAPANASLEVGSTQQYTATGTYSNDGTQDITASVTWNSSNTAAATIDSQGLATGVSPGTTSITATLGSVTSGPAALTVTAPSPTLSSIAVTPTNASLEVGSTQQYTATGTYSNGSTQDITASVTWNSSSTTVATIESGGLATGVSPGATSITATLGSTTSDPAALAVTSPSTPGEIQVASLEGSPQQRMAGKNIFVRAVVNVRIVNGAGAPVPGATVAGNWSDAVRGTATAVTDADGRATLTSPETKTRKNVNLRFVLTITDVQKTGYTYDDGGQPPSVTVSWP